MQQNDYQFVLADALRRVAHLLPAQGPIQDFIHHNTLHAFQSDPFDNAIKKASICYGAKSHMPIDFYRKAYLGNRISDKALIQAIEKCAPIKEKKFLSFLRLALFRYVDIKDEVAFWSMCDLRQFSLQEAKEYLQQVSFNLTAHSPGKNSIRERCAKQLQVDWDLEIHPILFRVTAGYLDQGILLWPFRNGDLPFLKFVQKLITDSFFPLAHFINKKRMQKWFLLSVDEIIEAILKKIVGDENLYETYIADTLMVHAGWSGMVNVLEGNPDCLRNPRSISLKEFLAFKLMLESELIESSRIIFKPIATGFQGKEGLDLQKAKIDAMSFTLFLLSLGVSKNEFNWQWVNHISMEVLEGIWQEAFELTYHKEAISSLRMQHIDYANTVQKEISAQLVFCIDDRECSFRRYLEELDPSIQTWGTAGFFGLDFCFQSLNDAFPVKLCPAPVTPRYLVKEIPAQGRYSSFEDQRRQIQKKALSLHRSQQASGSLILGFIAANTLGHLSFFWLLACLLNPARLIRSVLTKKIQVTTELPLLRNANQTSESPLAEGFTYDEMADRVFSVLRNMGLVHFCPLVVFIAHGSSSLNNPHFAAYDCGACSGRPGAPNARSFALMANMPEVRQRLAAKGMVIPATTYFVGAYHDTCVDTIEMFDLKNLPSTHENAMSLLQKTIDEARGLNARERCRRFAVVPLGPSPKDALKEVRHRASVLFEPRPELNHATNGLCVVGRRAFTRGLFLDRRAFLHSYDPNLDENGNILNQILNAVVPVCGGINLEYYFSRIDAAVYGCGTKLSHNVCSLLGVYNGIDDDLRTGLPVQMTEVHDPVRLLLVIEQNPRTVMQVLNGNKLVMQWIQNEWVKTVCIDPLTHEAFLFQSQNGFILLEDEQVSLPVADSSYVYGVSSRENLPIVRIKA